MHFEEEISFAIKKNKKKYLKMFYRIGAQCPTIDSPGAFKTQVIIVFLFLVLYFLRPFRYVKEG